MTTSAGGRGLRPILLVTAALLLVVPHLVRFRLLAVRGFGPDEFEHLHFAWRLSTGQVPYRDYFDHHTPWLHVLLVPLFWSRHVERSVTDAFDVIFLARRLTWVFAGAVLALTVALGARWREGRTALAAAVLLGNTAIFLRKALEIRPDVPATALWLAALLLGLLGFRDELTPGTRAVRLFASGLLLGASVMFTQKALFAFPGWFAALAWLWIEAREPDERRHRMRAIGLHLVGLALPLALTLLYLATHQAIGPFVQFNVFLNAHWPGLGPRSFVAELLRRDPVLVGLALLGGAKGVVRLRRRPRADEALIMLSALSLLAGLALLPAVTFHYFLFFLPLLALYAGATLVEGLDRAVGRAGWREGVLALVLVLLSVVPLLRLREAFQHTNQGTLDGIRYVLRNTAPWEPVMDGFSGLGVFRPSVSFYVFLHRDNWAIQSAEERRQLVEDLTSGRVSPRLVFWDHYLQEPLPPELAAFVERHYAAAGPDPIRARLDDGGAGWWSDAGPRHLGWSRAAAREPQVFVGEGWKQPESDDGMRATRGRVSELLVPLREPRAVKAVLRARADPLSAPRSLTLSVNAARLETLCVMPGEADYAFPVPAQDLRPGFNRFVFAYGARAACPEPAGQAAAGREELMMDTLALEP